MNSTNDNIKWNEIKKRAVYFNTIFFFNSKSKKSAIIRENTKK